MLKPALLFASTLTRRRLPARARSGNAWWIAPVTLAVVILILNLCRHTRLDGHEVLVAQTASEMLDDGLTLIPTFSGLPRLEKPPLAYYLAYITYQITGVVAPWTARLPSVFSALGLVLLVSVLAKRWFGTKVGFWAGVIQATSLWTITYGQSAIVDMTLTLLVSSLIAWMAFTDNRAARWILFRPIVAGVLAGLIALAKGPVGLAVAVPVVFLALWLTSAQGAFPNLSARDRGLRWIGRALGFLLFVTIACGWAALVLWKTPDVMHLWWGQGVARFYERWGPSHRPWFYYLYKVPMLTLPWVPLALYELVCLGRQTWRRWKTPSVETASSDKFTVDSGRRWILIWLGWSMMLFSVSVGKREHYILPALPALSLLAALGWTRLQSQWNWHPERRRLMNHGLIALVCLATIVVPTVIWQVDQRAEHRHAFLEDHADDFEQSDRILQYGLRDRSTIFTIGRPVHWPRTPDAFARWLPATKTPLVIVPAGRVHELDGVQVWRTIARETADTFAWWQKKTDPDDLLILLEPDWVVRETAP